MPQKGQVQGGECNRKACSSMRADYYNSTTRAWYCGRCAARINRFSEMDHGVTLCKKPETTVDKQPTSDKMPPLAPENLNSLMGRKSIFTPSGLQVTFDYEGRTLLGDVISAYKDVTGAARLRVRYFNGEPWPVDPQHDQVSVLERSSD